MAKNETVTPEPEVAPEVEPEEGRPAPTVASRFITAAGSEGPTQDQVAIVRAHQSAIVTAAEQVDQLPEGRYKALALTALEEALMWANKAVFAPA